MNFFFYVLLMICSLVTGTAELYSAIPVAIDDKAVVSYAQKNISSCGTLEVASDGFVYVKVSDEYISDLLPMLQKDLPDGAKLCPPLSTIGAHISVIFPQELPGGLGPFPEKGRKVCFSLMGLAEVEPEQSSYSKVIYLKVNAPDLERLRKRYKLPYRYNQRDFHITLAVEYPEPPPKVQ